MLSPTRATLLNVFGVVGRNDVLTRLGMVHDGLGVREKSIEAPVEDASGDEGVDIADAEPAQVEIVSVAPAKLRSTLASSKLFASKLLAGREKGGGSQMLTAQRDTGCAHACYNDVVDEAGEWGDAADEEGDDGAPIGSVSGRVAVDAVEVIHVGYGHVTASDNVVAAIRDKQISGYGRGR